MPCGRGKPCFDKAGQKGERRKGRKSWRTLFGLQTQCRRARLRPPAAADRCFRLRGNIGVDGRISRFLGESRGPTLWKTFVEPRQPFLEARASYKSWDRTACPEQTGSAVIRAAEEKCRLPTHIPGKRSRLYALTLDLSIIMEYYRDKVYPICVRASGRTFLRRKNTFPAASARDIIPWGPHARQYPLHLTISLTGQQNESRIYRYL